MYRTIKLSSLAVSALLLCTTPIVHATFSIVAVDTVNGVVGGAGASCIDNCQIITDIVTSVGAVHTQSWWIQANQTYAHSLLLQGLSPDSIIALLIANDAEGRPGLRQYGVVTFAGSGASAAYTGWGNSDWAGHRTGPGYAIQGNILLDSTVVTDMETAFLTTEGPLEIRLMAALEAAKRPGADSRCLDANKSALSAFIKVSKPGNSGYLYELVTSTPSGVDPIDSLRVRFDAWRVKQSAHPDSSTVSVAKTILEGDGNQSTTITVVPRNYAGKTPAPVDSVVITTSGAGVVSAVSDNGDGSYAATFDAPVYGAPPDTITVAVGAYYEFVTVLNQHPFISYYLCGDVNSDGGLKVSDLTYLVNFLFKQGLAPVVLLSADANGDGTVNVSDLTRLVSFLFSLGLPPVCE